MRSLSAALRSFVWIIHLLLRKPSFILLCLKPWGIGLGSWILFFWMAYSFKSDVDIQLATLIPDQFLEIISILVIPMMIILTGMIALLVALIANEYTIDIFIERTIHEADPGASSGMVRRSALQQTIDGLLRLFVTVPLTILCIIVGLIPIIGIVSLVLSGFIFGYALYDCPLCIMGYSFGQRFTYMKKAWREVFWLGSVFSLTFLIPGLSLLLLPVGYGAAVKLMTEPAPK